MDLMRGLPLGVLVALVMACSGPVIEGSGDAESDDAAKPES